VLPWVVDEEPVDPCATISEGARATSDDGRPVASDSIATSPNGSGQALHQCRERPGERWVALRRSSSPRTRHPPRGRRDDARDVFAFGRVERLAAIRNGTAAAFATSIASAIPLSVKPSRRRRGSRPPGR
jgi:hypothetical protein